MRRAGAGAPRGEAAVQREPHDAFGKDNAREASEALLADTGLGQDRPNDAEEAASLHASSAKWHGQYEPRCRSRPCSGIPRPQAGRPPRMVLGQ